MSPASKSTLRRLRDRKLAEEALRSLTENTGDVYENYRALYALWCSNNAAVPELRPLFRISGIEPDGAFSVTKEFREKVRQLAIEILPSMTRAKADKES